jgi:hypothetical protein
MACARRTYTLDTIIAFLASTTKAAPRRRRGENIACGLCVRARALHEQYRAQRSAALTTVYAHRMVGASAPHMPVPPAALGERYTVVRLRTKCGDEPPSERLRAKARRRRRSEMMTFLEHQIAALEDAVAELALFNSICAGAPLVRLSVGTSALALRVPQSDV